MATYSFEQSGSFFETVKKLRKKDPVAYERVRKKISEILENPGHFKPLSSMLKHYRRAAYVIAFRIIEAEGRVKFVAYGHHDEIYEKSFFE